MPRGKTKITYILDALKVVGYIQIKIVDILKKILRDLDPRLMGRCNI